MSIDYQPVILHLRAFLLAARVNGLGQDIISIAVGGGVSIGLGTVAFDVSPAPPFLPMVARVVISQHAEVLCVA